MAIRFILSFLILGVKINVFDQKSHISRIFKKSVLDFKDATFRL